MNLTIKTPEAIIQQLSQRPLHPWENQYLAHYSTYWDAILTDPRLLLIPVDDHLVHRSDGVFEAFRLIKNKFYLLTPHLKRLRLSAEALSLSVPWSDAEITTLLQELARAAGEANLIFRLYVSRGSGSFTANPYDSPCPHLTVVACRFKPYPKEKYSTGVTIGRSQYLSKSEPFCSIKSCNYLLNVLMKKESVDRKLDFTIAFNEQNYLTESSTENIFILSENNELQYPQYCNILKGTTLERCLELARQKLSLKTKEGDITEEQLLSAKEVFMIGTTLDILPVTQYEKKSYGVGPMSKKLLDLLHQDQS